MPASPQASAQAGTPIYYTHPANPGKESEKTTRSKGWQTLEPGYSVPTRSRPVDLPSQTFGPEVSFAMTMRQANEGGNPIAIIKVTRGGTNLRSDWSPKGYMYQAMIAEVKKALQALKDSGDEGVLRGMLWHQGESDSKRLDEYQGELETLITNARKELASPELPFVIGELAQSKPEAFRDLQRKIATDNDHVFFVSSKELNTTDGTHFDTDGQVVLGQRFAEIFRTPVLKPQSHRVDGAVRPALAVRR